MLALFLGGFILLSLFGLWAQKVDLLEKLYPKVPKFTPSFRFDPQKRKYNPVVIREGWFRRHKEMELDDSVGCSSPDEAIYNAKVLIDKVVVPIYKNPIPKYKTPALKLPPK